MRGVFLLPNMFTAGSLLCGLTAIFQVFDSGDWQGAIHLIFYAAALDAFDGFVARLTRTQSAFGMNFDSLADTVSFGVAPACIVYTAIAPEYPTIAWATCGLFAVFAAVRLARFNVQQSKEEKKTFQGLPTPGAALTAVSLFWALVKRPQFERVIVPEKILPIAMAALAFLMVSKFPYFGPKSIKLARRQQEEVFVAAVIMLFLVILLKQHLDLLAAAVFVPYALSGPALFIIQRWSAQRETSTVKRIPDGAPQPSDSAASPSPRPE